VCVTADLDAALDCDGLVVPGVGAYAACMAGLRRAGGDQAIAGRIAARRPVLGICVGMQVLFAAGVEHGVRTEGCNVWPGTVERLDAPVLPHMGWNTVAPPDGSVLFSGLDAGTRYYFVHSYALRMRDAAPLLSLGQPAAAEGDPAEVQPGAAGVRPGAAQALPGAGQGLPVRRPAIATAAHGEPFAAAVEDGLVCATQFHPEKSGDAGAQVLANWLGSL
jgi:imidazole glycerol-phosphate synthase subunit HisH